jgi:amidase
MPGDPYVAPPPARPYAEEVGADPGRLRIGLHLGPGREDAPAPDPEVLDAVAAAGRLLGELGHHVEESSPAALVDPGFAGHFLSIVVADIALLVRQLEGTLRREIRDDELEPRNATYRRAGLRMAAPDYLASRGWLGQWARRMASWWAAPDLGGEGYDLLVLPVIATVPPELGWYTAAGFDHEDERIGTVLQYTGQFNATGQPAISLPLGRTAAGLPIGVQMVAAAHREDLLVRLAAQVEQAAPWADRRPPVFPD